MTKGKIALLVVVGLGVAARAALPSVIKSQINRRLAALDGYEGSVADVDLAVLRGVIALESLELRDKDGKLGASVPLLAVDWEWLPLLRRSFVGSVGLQRPTVAMSITQMSKEEAKEAKGAAAQAAGKEPAKPIHELLAEMIPFRIDRFDIVDGTVRLRETKSNQEARITDLQFKAEHLTNRPRGSKDAMAEAVGSANVQGTGKAELAVKIDPTAKQPKFDLAARVLDIDLKSLNPMLRAQLGVDVTKGKFEMVAEAHASSGAFKGYVKPFIEDLKMLGGPKDKGVGKIAKEAVVGAVASVLKSADSDAVATKVPIEGRFDDPEIGVWPAVGAVLKNAFVKALTPSFD